MNRKSALALTIMILIGSTYVLHDQFPPIPLHPGSNELVELFRLYESNQIHPNPTKSRLLVNASKMATDPKLMYEIGAELVLSGSVEEGRELIRKALENLSPKDKRRILYDLAHMKRLPYTALIVGFELEGVKDALLKDDLGPRIKMAYYKYLEEGPSGIKKVSSVLNTDPDILYCGVASILLSKGNYSEAIALMSNRNCLPEIKYNLLKTLKSGDLPQDTQKQLFQLLVPGFFKTEGCTNQDACEVLLSKSFELGEEEFLAQHIIQKMKVRVLLRYAYDKIPWNYQKMLSRIEESIVQRGDHSLALKIFNESLSTLYPGSYLSGIRLAMMYEAVNRTDYSTSVKELVLNKYDWVRKEKSRENYTSRRRWQLEDVLKTEWFFQIMWDHEIEEIPLDNATLKTIVEKRHTVENTCGYGNGWMIEYLMWLGDTDLAYNITNILAENSSTFEALRYYILLKKENNTVLARLVRKRIDFRYKDDRKSAEYSRDLYLFSQGILTVQDIEPYFDNLTLCNLLWELNRTVESFRYCREYLTHVPAFTVCYDGFDENGNPIGGCYPEPIPTVEIMDTYLERYGDTQTVYNVSLRMLNTYGCKWGMKGFVKILRYLHKNDVGKYDEFLKRITEVTFDDSEQECISLLAIGISKWDLDNALLLSSKIVDKNLQAKTLLEIAKNVNN